jgi:hypothetical protein
MKIPMIAFHEEDSNVVVVKPKIWHQNIFYFEDIPFKIDVTGVIGKAKCNPLDKFSIGKGINIATTRCLTRIHKLLVKQLEPVAQFEDKFDAFLKERRLKDEQPVTKK